MKSLCIVMMIYHAGLGSSSVLEKEFLRHQIKELIRRKGGDEEEACAHYSLLCVLEVYY